MVVGYDWDGGTMHKDLHGAYEHSHPHQYFHAFELKIFDQAVFVQQAPLPTHRLQLSYCIASELHQAPRIKFSQQHLGSTGIARLEH